MYLRPDERMAMAELASIEGPRGTSTTRADVRATRRYAQLQAAARLILMQARDLEEEPQARVFILRRAADMLERELRGQAPTG